VPPPGAGLNSLTLCVGAVSWNVLKKSVLASHMTEPCLPTMQAGLLPPSQQRDSLQLHNATPIAQQVRHRLQVSAVNLHVHPKLCSFSTYQECRTSMFVVVLGLQAAGKPLATVSSKPLPGAVGAGRTEVVITSGLAATQVHLYPSIRPLRSVLLCAADFQYIYQCTII
jgi:hypothetical protein